MIVGLAVLGTLRRASDAAQGQMATIAAVSVQRLTRPTTAQMTTAANGTSTPRANMIVAKELGTFGIFDSWKEETSLAARGKPVDYRLARDD